MRPSIAAGVGATILALVIGAVVVDAVEPVVSRPPEEARVRPVTLPSNSPMTPADPPAAPTPRDSSWGVPDAASLVAPLGAPSSALGLGSPLSLAEEIPLAPDQPAAAPVDEASAGSRRAAAPRPTRTSPAWHHDPEASWYGPGFYGKRTACGLAMTKTLIGVAHRSLPCGTLVVFRNGDRTLTVPVVDRGPYVDGRIWDLTGAAALALDHAYTGPIDWRLK